VAFLRPSDRHLLGWGLTELFSSKSLPIYEVSGSGSKLPGSHCGGQGSILGESVRDLL
jgi:hypothetical protein